MKKGRDSAECVPLSSPPGLLGMVLAVSECSFAHDTGNQLDAVLVPVPPTGQIPVATAQEVEVGDCNVPLHLPVSSSRFGNVLGNEFDVAGQTTIVVDFVQGMWL